MRPASGVRFEAKFGSAGGFGRLFGGHGIGRQDIRRENIAFGQLFLMFPVYFFGVALLLWLWIVTLLWDYPQPWSRRRFLAFLAWFIGVVVYLNQLVVVLNPRK